MSSRRQLFRLRSYDALVELLEVGQVADQTESDGARVADAASDRVATLVDADGELVHGGAQVVASMEELRGRSRIECR